VAHKLRRIVRYFGCDFHGAAGNFRNGNLAEMRERCVYRGEVLSNHGLTTFSVALANELLDFRYRFLAWQHAAQCKETRLHDRVDAITKLALLCYAARIDCIDLQP